ncbi:MAG: hypothetical protein ABI183_27485 [Polyangiaceae bacterium]
MKQRCYRFDVTRNSKLTEVAYLSGLAMLLAAVGCHHPDRDQQSSPSTSATTSTDDAAPASLPSATDASAAREDAGSGSDHIRDVARPGGAASLRWQTLPLPDASLQVAAISYDRAARTVAELNAELALVDVANAQAPTLLGTAKIAVDPDACDAPTGNDDDAPELALDLAPYRITDQERAIGVRVTCHQTFPAGEASRSELVLFARSAASAKASLEDVFRISVADHEEQRGPGDAIDELATVSVLPRKTAGHFDLSVRRTTTIASLDATAGRPAKTRVATMRFVWNGSRYVASTEAGK